MGSKNNESDILGNISPKNRRYISNEIINEENIINWAKMVIDFHEYNISDILKKIDIPILMIAAEYDLVVDCKSIKDIVQLYTNCYYEEIKVANHYCLIENSIELVEIIQKFYKRG